MGLELGGQRARETIETEEIEEHDWSRLGRFIDLAEAKGAVIDLMDDPPVFAGMRTGEMVRWECEMFIPEMSRIFTAGDELKSALDAISALAPVAAMFGSDTSGLPKPSELDTLKRVTQGLNAPPVVIGESEDIEWRVTGTLSDKKTLVAIEEFEGRAILIGKVRKCIAKGRWMPIPALPGVSLVPREQARQMAVKGPKNESEQAMYVAGPLLVLDILAIYR